MRVRVKEAIPVTLTQNISRHVVPGPRKRPAVRVAHLCRTVRMRRTGIVTEWHFVLRCVWLWSRATVCPPLCQGSFCAPRLLGLVCSVLLLRQSVRFGMQVLGRLRSPRMLAPDVFMMKPAERRSWRRRSRRCRGRRRVQCIPRCHLSFVRGWRRALTSSWKQSRPALLALLRGPGACVSFLVSGVYMQPQRGMPPSIHIFSISEMLVLVARVGAWRHSHGELCRVLGRDWCVCVHVMNC